MWIFLDYFKNKIIIIICSYTNQNIMSRHVGIGKWSFQGTAAIIFECLMAFC